jgi:Flp pilus assembly pilin Flp
MITIIKIVKGLYEDERGQGLMEYSLILSLVSVIVILVLTGIGNVNNNTVNKIASEMKD